MPLLEARGLGLRRGGAWAFRGVDLALEAGEAWGLAGESGSGKSSLIWTLLGLLEPDEGEVRLAGNPWSGLPERARRSRRPLVQAVLQGALGGLPPHLSALELLEEPLRVHGLPVARARELAARVRFPEDALALRPGQLSGGMGQRLLLGRALALQPRLLVLDEPHAGLDASLALAFLELLATLKGQGTALLLASHDLAALARLCDGATVFCGSAVLAAGPARELLGEARHPYVRGLWEARPGLDGRRPHPWGRPEGRTLEGPGCVLRARCPVADARCETAPPPEGRCHHPLEGLESTRVPFPG